MKKLKLNLQNMEGAEVLSREQLKTILGGFEQGSGCGNVYSFGNGLRCVSSGISKSDAIQNSYDYNTGNYSPDVDWGGGVTDVNWCCQSCANFYPCEGEA